MTTEPLAAAANRFGAGTRIVVKIGSALVVDPAEAAPRTAWLLAFAGLFRMARLMAPLKLGSVLQ